MQQKAGEQIVAQSSQRNTKLFSDTTKQKQAMSHELSFNQRFEGNKTSVP